LVEAARHRKINVCTAKCSRGGESGTASILVPAWLAEPGGAPFFVQIASSGARGPHAAPRLFRGGIRAPGPLVPSQCPMVACPAPVRREAAFSDSRVVAGICRSPEIDRSEPPQVYLGSPPADPAGAGSSQRRPQRCRTPRSLESRSKTAPSNRTDLFRQPRPRQALRWPVASRPRRQQPWAQGRLAPVWRSLLERPYLISSSALSGDDHWHGRQRY